MPTKPCPVCQAETVSAPPHPNVHVQGAVWYFNCLTCAHTWAVCKVDETIVHHVTPLPKTVGPKP